MFPTRDRDAKAVGAQLREHKGDNDRGFRALGQTSQVALFGQHLFPTNGKRLIITEGAFDAMSVYHMLGGKYPTVSVINGTGSAMKDVKLNMDYIEGYSEVILCFDNDKPGREKAKEIAHQLTPGKAHIVPLVKHKDANDYLVHGAFKDFTAAFWDKKRYQPDGIVNLADLYENLMTQGDLPSIPYPWEGLNNMLDGIRDAELVTITSGSGMGKSSVMRELEYWLLTQTQDMIGILALEETPERLQRCFPSNRRYW